ncbi:follistatin-related 5-like [Paramuricea clavata]|uniref:Follistatin-related 5-like n=1 Tax=Paramuricea clavata TaxID=317549 RepID=A0A6S7I6W3_PARCT|nr:follistatin-related 5-like [Paramuricea clavata]
MEMRVMALALFICAFLLEYSASVKTNTVFYVLGSDGIYVIDPVAKSVVTKINDMTSPGLCTESNIRGLRNPCSFSQASVVHDTVFVADASGSAVHVIDVKTRTKIETIPTDVYPYGLHFLPWRKEVWVHSWNISTFDVIETEGRNRTHTAIRAHVKPGFTHGIMLADKDMLEGKAAYVTHFSNPGIHKLNLETKSYTGFLNFTKYGCSGTYGIVYNSYNKRLYVECQSLFRSVSILELNAANDSLTKEYKFPGSPFVSPNGRYVVVLYRYKSRTNITTSRMNILAVSGSGVEHYPELRIPGGVSHAVFYPKSKNSDSYNVFITLDYSDKMAVVDLDVAKNGNISDVKYIENIDFLDSKPHGASRKLFISGKWIISPATKSKTVVIINAETQKVHGKVSGVNGGDLAVWVRDSTTNISGIASPNSLMIFLIFVFGFLQL